MSEEFKQAFETMATKYIKYVDAKLEAHMRCKNAAPETGIVEENAAEKRSSYHAGSSELPYMIMNEVRAANAVATTLHRISVIREYDAVDYIRPN